MTATSSPTSPSAAGTVLHGVPVVAGVQYAPVIRPGAPPDLSADTTAELAEGERADEVQRFTDAAATVATRLRERAGNASGAASEVLAATATLAQDRGWLGAAEKRIKDGAPAVGAVNAAIDQFVEMFTKMGGLMAERVTDLRDIRSRVIAQLKGLPEPGVPVPDEPSILCAEDLAPADTAGLDPALVVALVLRGTLTKGEATGFIMELPRYQLPSIADIAIGLWQRAWVFLRRAGTIIFSATVILWVLLSFPQAEPGESQVDVSIAGQIADGLNVVLEPIGFNREISLALVPAMAAREVAVSALATTYAIDATDEEAEAEGLASTLSKRWSLPTALAFLAWFVFAPQCLSTIAVARRETNGWKWPAFMVGYLFALAYIFAGITYWSAVALGL